MFAPVQQMAPFPITTSSATPVLHHRGQFIRLVADAAVMRNRDPATLADSRNQT